MNKELEIKPSLGQSQSADNTTVQKEVKSPRRQKPPENLCTHGKSRDVCQGFTVENLNVEFKLFIYQIDVE